MAISVSEILGQDSPNSGRLKVNTNFDTIVSEVNSHGGLLGSLVGGVCDLNSGQTLTNKTLVSNNWDGSTEHGAGSNNITIGHYDIYDNYFSFTNHYPGITVGAQHTTYVNKTTTYNNVNISGFGGFTPEIDTTTSTLAFGFPETAKLNHPDGGTQSLVINADTKLGAAVLDVNGSSTFRSKVEVGDAADGNYDHDLHITYGDGGTNYTTVALETNSTTGTNRLLFKRNYNSGATLTGKYLGEITFRGTYGSGANFSNESTATRIRAITTEQHDDVDSQGSKLEFFTVPNSATAGTAVKVMTIDQNSNVGIGKANTEAKLHVQATSGGAGGSSGVSANANLALFESDSDAGITIKSPNNEASSIYFADEDANNQGSLIYRHATNNLEYCQTGTLKLIIAPTGYIGIGSATPTEAIEAIGTAGSPLKIKADVHIVATGVTSHPDDPAAFYLHSDTKPYISTTSSLNFRSHTQDHTIVTMDSTGGQFGFVGINKTDPDIPLHIVQNNNTIRKGLRVEGNSGGDIDLYMTGNEGVLDISNKNFEVRPGNLNGAANSLTVVKVDTEYDHWPEDLTANGLNDDTLQRLYSWSTQSGVGNNPGAQTRVGINVNSGTIADLHDTHPYTLTLGGAGSQFWALGEGMSFTSQGNYYGGSNDARLLTIHDSASNPYADGGFSIQSMTTGAGPQFRPIAHFRTWGSNDLSRVGIGTKKNPSYSLDTDGSINADGSLLIGGTITSTGAITTQDTIIVNGQNNIVVNDISIDINDSQNPTDSTQKRMGLQIKGDTASYDAAATVQYQTYYVHEASDKKPVLYAGFQDGSTEQEGGIYLAGKSAVRLPKGNFSEQPGESNWVDPEVGMMRYTTATHNGKYPGGYFECYQRTNSSNHAWVHIATPPIGTGYMQWHGMDEPMVMYPNTTWELGSMPEDVFIRNEGQDQNNTDYFGAKPFNGAVQKQTLVQHEHKIHRPHGDSGTEFDRAHNGDSDPMYYKQHHDFSTGAYFTGSDMDSWYADNTDVGAENRPLNVTVRFWKRTA